MNARPESTAASSIPGVDPRSALALAQAAVWDWNLADDRMHVEESWLRALGVDAADAAMPVAEWRRRIHPDDLGAFLAATESCEHGGDRFECEYRLLAAAHR